MRNAPINPTDECLCDAVLDGNKDQVGLIIDNHGGNVNAQNQYGASPALLAAKCNNLNMLKLLVERGADLKISDDLNQTPLDWAEHNKNQLMIDFINEQTSKFQPT